MYIFILVVFLQTSPLANVLFVQTYETKADCLAGAEYLKDKVPEDKRDEVMCLQVVSQDKVKEI